MQIASLERHNTGDREPFGRRVDEESTTTGRFRDSITPIFRLSSEAAVANKHSTTGVNIIKSSSSVSLVKPKASAINCAKKFNKSRSEGVLRVVRVGADEPDFRREFFVVLPGDAVTSNDSRRKPIVLVRTQPFGKSLLITSVGGEDFFRTPERVRPDPVFPSVRFIEPPVSVEVE
jgi:hypothetical protein